MVDALFVALAVAVAVSKDRLSTGLFQGAHHRHSHRGAADIMQMLRSDSKGARVRFPVSIFGAIVVFIVPS